MNKTTEENFLEKVYLGQKKRVRIDQLDEEINEEEMKTRNKEKSNEYEVKPRIREYREKQSKTAIIDKTKEKQEQIERYFKQIEEERKELQKYIQNGKIEIKKLPTIKSSFRKTLLKWISKASQMANKEIVIEDGRKIKLIYPINNERCVLNCEDGKMDMPAFELEFIEKID